MSDLRIGESGYVWVEKCIKNTGRLFAHTILEKRDPPPNEPHPDELKKRIAELETKLEEAREIQTIAWFDGRADGNAAVRAAKKLQRCEICKYHGVDIESDFEITNMCLLGADRCCVPDTRNCDGWTYDGHNTKKD